MKNCCYCKETFDDEDCRPYGTDGADTCYPCAMLPENRPTADRLVQEAIDRALAISPSGVLIGHHSGPLPLGDGENN